MIRFIDNKDGTVTDTTTNLMWQQGAGIQLAFEDAQKYAASLTLAGYRDWKLPTIMELLTLVDYNKKSPAIDPVFECVSDYYWSGTRVTYFPYGAWIVFFNYGFGAWGGKTFAGYVRCVRNVKE